MNRLKTYLPFVLLCFPCGYVQAESSSIEQAVATELCRGQLYDGETFDRLTGLGPQAALELSKYFYAYEFPYEILLVLAEFRDRATVPALHAYVRYLREQEPDEVLLGAAIEVLKEIGDPSSERILLEIRQAEDASMSDRIAALTALARLGSPAVKAKAGDEIMSQETWSEFLADDPESGKYYGIYCPALCEVFRPEADAILVRVISFAENWELGDILEPLSKHPDTCTRAEVLEALLKRAESPQDDGMANDRLAVLLTLWELQCDIPASRLHAIIESIERANPELAVPSLEAGQLSRFELLYGGMKWEVAARLRLEKVKDGTDVR